MTYLTKLERLSGPLPPMCEVALGAAEALEAEPGADGQFTSEAMAEALTFAQDYVHPRERRPIPISVPAAGQWLGRLRERGYVEYLGHGWWRLTDGPVLHTEVPAVLIEQTTTKET